ncbi:MAG: tyrosine-type recombinase/integrase [Oligoflexia bacterium]|nr:tyrosine-type recombinase/integrase [Oligoflexia bacterium]
MEKETTGLHNTSYVNHLRDHQLIKKYFIFSVEGQSPLTIKSKEYDLKKFLNYYSENKGHDDFSKWHPINTREFIEELKREGYSPSTINRMFASLKSFANFLLEEKIVDHNPTKNIKQLQLPASTPKRVEDDEWEILKKVAEELVDKSTEHYRNYILLRLLDASGLRISEVLGLRVGNFRGDQNRLCWVYCKGGKVRDVLISQECSKLLQDFVQSRKLGERDLIFTNYQGGALSRVGAAKILNNIAELASKRLGRTITLHAHRLRHMHAFKCKIKMGEAWTIERLGHSGFNYLNRYTTIDSKREQELINTL